MLGRRGGTAPAYPFNRLWKLLEDNNDYGLTIVSGKVLFGSYVASLGVLMVFIFSKSYVTAMLYIIHSWSSREQ